MIQGSLSELDVEGRLARLESDKDALQIQVSLLSAQIEAQMSKIRALEAVLDEKKNALESTQERLSRELLISSSLETQRLELLAQISNLRFKQATLERENFDLKDQMVDWWTCNERNNDRILRKPPLPVVRLRSPPPSIKICKNASFDGVRDVTLQNRARTPPPNMHRRVDSASFHTLTLPRRKEFSQLTAFNNGTTILDANLIASGCCNSNYSSNFCSSSTTGGLLFRNVVHPAPNQPRIFYSQRLTHGPALCRSTCNSACVCNGGFGSLFPCKDIGTKSTSAPNLVVAENYERFADFDGKKSLASSNRPKERRSLSRLLSRFKRSSSCGLETDIAQGFASFTDMSQATSTPRRPWIREPNSSSMVLGPIDQWDSAAAAKWMSSLGLTRYCDEMKRWFKSGQQILEATTTELEKELGIKNSMHRKKLSLAISVLKNPMNPDVEGRLDCAWVMRWLDDIGLPQYKGTFIESKVDGRVLSSLTAQDLVSLKVTSALHHISIQRGIQLLRIHSFHPACLCRRSIEDSRARNSNPEEVAAWSNHRVMEWLTEIQLSEYAPNLRGSGVHGALLIFEPMFNEDLLATLLAIPTDKTLLRRHLREELNRILGPTIVRQKKHAEEFNCISPKLRVKIIKPTKMFSLKKKREKFENEHLLCPLEWNYFPF